MEWAFLPSDVRKSTAEPARPLGTCTRVSRISLDPPRVLGVQIVTVHAVWCNEALTERHHQAPWPIRRWPHLGSISGRVLLDESR